MKKFALLLFALLLTSLPGKTQAAGVSLELQKPNLEVGQQQELKVVFDKQDSPVNGLEGQILLPINLLSDIKIKDGNSSVSLWVQKPEVVMEKGSAAINFSAISPAGINGYLFSILFTSQSTGKGQFEFQGNMLLADGQGTREGLKTEILPVSFVPSTAPINQAPTAPDFTQDHTSPEEFVISVARDPKILNNQWFAVFNAQDKDSGLAFYEVLETVSQDNPELQKGWEKSTSPYVFKDQTLNKYLFVKAVDRNGNYRIANWHSPNFNNQNNGQKTKFYVIIIIVIILVIALLFELYLRRHKKQNLKF